MFGKISTRVNFSLLLLTVVILYCFSASVVAQQRKVPKEPFQIVDASTGKPIQEVIVIPRYSSFEGVSTMLGEGPGSGTYKDYLDKPFVYRTGELFLIKRPRSGGLPLLPFVFIGKVRSIEGILIIAPKYRPLWVSNLWSTSDERKLNLTPILDNEWSLLMEKELSPLVKDHSQIEHNCRIWDLPEQCNLKIYYNEKERGLILSFLQKNWK